MFIITRLQWVIPSLLLLSTPSLHAESLWDKTKNAVSNTADMITSEETKQGAADLWDKTKTAVTDTTGKVVDTADQAMNDESTPAEQKAAINANAEQTMQQLFAESQEAKELYDKASGYAVFDSREFAFLLKTGFGSGVAVNRENNETTYMKMASAGVNIGGGVKYIKVIFIFPTKQTFTEFVTHGWNAEGDASAVGGDDSAQLGMTLSNGTKVYELVDTGIMLKMSISGTKYWKDKELNLMTDSNISQATDENSTEAEMYQVNEKNVTNEMF